MGDARMEGVARTYLSRIALLSGDAALAEREAAAAAVLLAVAPSHRPAAIAAQARALLALGRDAEALATAREAAAALEAAGGLPEGESLVRLVLVEALGRAGDEAGRAAALAVARERLLARAARIAEPGERETFLHAVPDNARTLEAVEDDAVDRAGKPGG
jgi:eukaryotic-like serine/threonine-protein kinase